MGKTSRQSRQTGTKTTGGSIVMDVRRGGLRKALPARQTAPLKIGAAIRQPRRICYRHYISWKKTCQQAFARPRVCAP